MERVKDFHRYSAIKTRLLRMRSKLKVNAAASNSGYDGSSFADLSPRVKACVRKVAAAEPLKSNDE
jgi:hypothetical protein